MVNWGFLTSLFSYLKLSSFSNGNKYLSSRQRKNLLKLIVSSFALLYFGYFLKKIYEVPVYVTKIDTITSNCDFDKDRGVSVFFIRNYDREDKNSLYRDSLWRANFPENMYAGGITVYGIGKVQQGISIGNKENIDLVRDSIEALSKKFNYPIIEDGSFIYISIQSSLRQDIRPPHISLFTEEEKYFSDKTVTRAIYNGQEVIRDTLFYHRAFRYASLKEQKKFNGISTQGITVVSKEDSLMEFDGNFLNMYEFGMPGLFAAEDVSKLVEIIYIDQKKAKEESLSLCSAINNITIDYVGPAEFSNHIFPEPDVVTISSIHYTDSLKIQEIGRNGLRFHVSFPDMENKQESRIFILSAIVTALGALVLRYLWRIMYAFYKKISIVLNSTRVVIVFLDILILILMLILIYKLLKGIYYSNVDPFTLYNPLVN